MKVSSIVIPVEQLSINDTISTAISLMYSKNVDIVPVYDQQKDLIGALTHADLLTALQSGIPMTGTLEGHLSDRTANLSMDEEVEGIPVSAIPSLVIGEGGAVIGVVSMEAYVAALQVTNSKFRQQVSSIMDSA